MSIMNKVPPLNIALIAESRATYLARGHSEADVAALPHDGEIAAVLSALEQLGHRVTPVAGIHPLVKLLAAGQHKSWDLVFNMSQGFDGAAREAQVPALLEAFKIAHTFSDAATMALCQNKANAKIVLNHHNIPTAPFVVIPASSPIIPPSPLHYPLFIKPLTEGSSKGIEGFNKVPDPASLALAVRKLRTRFPTQDMLVESFLSGREYTVSILGSGAAGRVIGVREHLWQRPSDSRGAGRGGNKEPNGKLNGEGNGQGNDYASREDKCSNGDGMRFNDELDMDDAQVQAVCRVALDAWAVFGCRDAGRVDLRFDNDGEDGVPNVLEVNPIGGLLPHHSPLPSCAEKNGISFQALLAAIVASAYARKQ